VRKSFVVSLLVASFALLSLRGSADAAAGSLDPTFGKGGKVLTSFNHCGLGVVAQSKNGQAKISRWRVIWPI
jgi:hypothetical protein